MLTPSTHVVAVDRPTGDPRQKQLLRDLNKEYRDTQAALNQAQASFNRAIRLSEDSYRGKRQAILANGHDDTAEERT
jgi:hypothetical protein